MSDDTLTAFSAVPDAEQHLEQQPEVQPAYVTKDELVSMKDELLKAIQSTKDKRIGKLEERVQSWAEAMRAQGIEVTDNMMAQGRTKLAMAELEKPLDAETVAQPPSGPPPTPEDVEEINLYTAEQIMRHKFALRPGDPELSDPNLKSLDKAAFKAAFDKAMARKAQRLGRVVEQPPVQPTPTGNPDRVTSTQGAAPGGNLEENITKRLTEIQRADPFGKNKQLAAERKQINLELEALHRNRK
jgi:hypothetical protein